MSSTRPSRHLLAATVCLAVSVAVAACGSSDPTDSPPASSVPTSAAVTVPPGAPARTAPGTALDFGASAVLPADTFRPAGPTAMYTVTGITPGTGVPTNATQGGTAYFVYVTVTSLAARPAPAPGVVGIAGSADGRSPALTLPPPVALANCANPKPPETMKRGDSYATCLVAYANPDQHLTSVIYWADTTGDEGFDFKQSPVVWSNPAAASASAPAPSAPPAN